MRHGETGTKFYVIRYGKVRVMRPLPNGETAEICKLRRGQFVGERTLITGVSPPQDYIRNTMHSLSHSQNSALSCVT